MMTSPSIVEIADLRRLHLMMREGSLVGLVVRLLLILIGNLLVEEERMLAFCLAAVRSLDGSPLTG